MKNYTRIILFCFMSLLLLPFYQNCSNNMAPLNLDQSSDNIDSLSSEAITIRASSILQNRCAACHNESMAMGEISYITDVNALQYYRLIVKYEPLLSPLYTVLNEEEQHMMLLSQPELEVIYKWISDGLGAGGAGGVAPPSAIPLAPTFTSIRANIIAPKCAGCHTPNAGNNNMPSGRFDQSTHQAITSSNGLGTTRVIMPNNAAGSRYVQRIVSTDPAFRMPRNAPAPLSPQEIQVITDWINAGAPNN
jgi:hypothetical protein